MKARRYTGGRGRSIRVYLTLLDDSTRYACSIVTPAGERYQCIVGIPPAERLAVDNPHVINDAARAALAFAAEAGLDIDSFADTTRNGDYLMRATPHTCACHSPASTVNTPNSKG